MEAVKMMDLSFLTREEQELIQDVLDKDATLRKREEARIRKIKPHTDPECLKLLSGEWFEDLKSRRYVRYSSATDLLKYAFQQQRQKEILISRGKSWLSSVKEKSLNNLQRIFKESTTSLNKSTKRENKGALSGCCAEVESSVAEILKDLEKMLEQELENNNSDADIEDISGFGLENEMVDKMLPVDYSSHQVWHYPETRYLSPIKEESILTLSPDLSSLVETNTLETTAGIFSIPVLPRISLIENNYNVSENYILPRSHHVTEGSVNSIHNFHTKSQMFKTKSKLTCSSPCEENEFYAFKEDKDQAFEWPSKCNTFKDNENQSFDWPSLDTDSTIEPPTLLAFNSLSLIREDKQYDVTSSQAGANDQLKCSQDSPSTPCIYEVEEQNIHSKHIATLEHHPHLDNPHTDILYYSHNIATGHYSHNIADCPLDCGPTSLEKVFCSSGFADNLSKSGHVKILDFHQDASVSKCLREGNASNYEDDIQVIESHTINNPPTDVAATKISEEEYLDIHVNESIRLITPVNFFDNTFNTDMDEGNIHVSN